MAEAAFRTQAKVLFQHCDPAGIVFYPRYFEMINAVIEEWFEAGLGVSFADLVGPRRAGVPTARIEATFHAPSRLGDLLDFALEVTRLGGASLDIAVRASAGGEARLTCTATLVHVDRDSLRAVRWPDDLRARLDGARP